MGVNIYLVECDIASGKEEKSEKEGRKALPFISGSFPLFLRYLLLALAKDSRSECYDI